MADKQKYNFLTALLRQVKDAGRDGDELYQEWCDLVRNGAPSSEFERLLERFDDVATQAVDRIDAHAQWLAALEARVEDVEQAVELFAGEEADGDDDGLDDEDVGGDEPRMGGDSRNAGRSPSNLVRAGERQVAGRRVGPQGSVPGTRADSKPGRVAVGRTVGQTGGTK